MISNVLLFLQNTVGLTDLRDNISLDVCLLSGGPPPTMTSNTKQSLTRPLSEVDKSSRIQVLPSDAPFCHFKDF